MIKLADKNDANAIRELWNIAFGEDRAFNDYFFDNIFKCENTLIMCENNKLISMAQMLPFNIKNIGDVTYIYGAATNPLERGKGYMKTLLEKSFEIDKKLGRCASILIPASESLFCYYSKIGYKTGFYADIQKYIMTDNIAFDFREADYGDINAMQNLYRGDVTRDYDYFKKQMDMFKSLGANVFVLCDGNVVAYAFVWDDIVEIMCSKEVYKPIFINHIMKYYDRDSIKATSIGNKPFGMIKYHIDGGKYNMYMNLMYN